MNAIQLCSNNQSMVLLTPLTQGFIWGEGGGAKGGTGFCPPPNCCPPKIFNTQFLPPLTKFLNEALQSNPLATFT